MATFSDGESLSSVRTKLNNTSNDVDTLQTEMTQAQADITALENITGWGEYTDTQYLIGSPFAVAAATRTKIPNNGASGVRTQIPSDYLATGLYNATSSKIIGQQGDALSIVPEFIVSRQSGNGTFSITLDFDIGGQVGALYPRTLTLLGNAAQNIVFGQTVYCYDTWANNGADLFINSTVAINIYSIRFVIFRLHKGRSPF